MPFRRPAEELYDLDHDPFELNNLAADPSHEPTVATFRTELETWIKRTQDNAAPEDVEEVKKAFELYKNRHWQE